MRESITRWLYFSQSKVEKSLMGCEHRHKTLFSTGFYILKQICNAYTKRSRELIQHQNVGAGESTLPFWYRLRCKPEVICNLVLFFARFAPQICKSAAEFFRVQHWHLLFREGGVYKERNTPGFFGDFPFAEQGFSYLLVGVRYPWGERKISDFVRIEHNPPPFFEFILKMQLYFPHSPTRKL